MARKASLEERLAEVLPIDITFYVYHLSTPPTRTEALYSPPPNDRPDRTYVEKHFFGLAIPGARLDAVADAPDSTSLPSSQPLKVFVFAIEVLIYTTAFATTLFVSKADSTGCIDALGGYPSLPTPFRDVSSVFISYLVEHRRREGVQCVVSLFARAQHSYLFPGSHRSTSKHVQDDRGLVRWWCRVLNPLLEDRGKDTQPREKIQAYLVVPGLDTLEARALLPGTPESPSYGSWTIGHPMELISHYCREYDSVPARCLIPRYPDDPKSRFRDELDEEMSKSQAARLSGQWKSVRTVDHFWEMMAFRQECSSGRLTGFIWVVLDPVEHRDPQREASGSSTAEMPSSRASRVAPKKGTSVSVSKTRSRKSVQNDSVGSAAPTKHNTSTKKPKRLAGTITPREPRIKRHQKNYLLDRPISTPYYHWPEQGRGEKIVSESDYNRAMELLLRLEFSKLTVSTVSTLKWITEVGAATDWGVDIVGKKERKKTPPASDSSGLAKRKWEESSPARQGSTGQTGVNVLSAGLIRKKRKDG